MEGVFCSVRVFKEIVLIVNRHGPKEDIKKCKKKIMNLKDKYKKAKENNKKSGAAPKFCPFYEDFDEVLLARDIVNIPGLTEIGVKRSVTTKTSHNEDEIEELSENFCE